MIAFQRSPHAHARIVSVDADAARAMPGVLARLHRRRAGRGRRQADADDARLPARRRPHDGDARRAAPSRTSACASSASRSSRSSPRRARRRATPLEAVVVDYEELPAVIDAAPRRRRRAGALPSGARQHRGRDAPRQRRRDRRRVRARRGADRARPRQPARRAGRRWSRAASSPSFDAASGRLTVRISNQMPTAVAAALAGALPGLAQEQIRVVVGDVGGGFGMKTGAYPEDIVVAHAARALGRPVRWQADRSEDFLSASHGRDVAQPRRARARRRRQGAGAARALARQRRRLRDAGAASRSSC